MALRLLLTGDSHLMNQPDDLTVEELHKQFFPALFNHRWIPKVLVRWVIGALRRSALRTMEKMDAAARRRRDDWHISLGDQIHGIAERGAVGRAGRLCLEDYLARARRFSTHGDLIHVPSEHPLGYWEGEDYFPHLEWHDGRPRFALAIHRDIGGAMNLEAINTWTATMGPLWGAKKVEGFTLVWMTGDFLRWRTQVRNDPRLSRLAEEQDLFLAQTLEGAEPGSVILFTHRPNVVFEDSTLNRFHDRLHAVVFADYHDARRAAKAIKAFPPHQFETWFVPALWGLQLGLGHCGYATLSLDEGRASFTTYVL